MPTVSIKNENKEFEVEVGEVIFDGLDNKGYELPHGCLAGSCGACRIEVLEGNEYLNEPSPIEKNTLEAITQNYKRIHGENALQGKTVRLSCRARLASCGKVVIQPLK